MKILLLSKPAGQTVFIHARNTKQKKVKKYAKGNSTFNNNIYWAKFPLARFLSNAALKYMKDFLREKSPFPNGEIKFLNKNTCSGKNVVNPPPPTHSLRI